MSYANHVAWRWYLSGELKTITPLIIGSGEDRNADVQCVRDGCGRFFIPGTTLAGVLRHALFKKPAGDDDDVFSRAFGEAKDDGRQSLLLFHDAPLLSERPRFTVRDGVALDKTTKTAEDKKKFDYEVIEREQIFRFRMEALLREKDIAKGGVVSMKTLCDSILGLLTGGWVRIGAKRNRGFGKIVLENLHCALFDFSDPEKRKSEGVRWLAFDWSEAQLEPFSAISPGMPSEYISVCAGFDIPGAMFIRSYSTDPKAPDVVHTTSPDPDAVHITSRGVSVIPGTSWAGALRHAMYNIGRTMRVSEKMDLLTRSLFGEVREKDKNKAFSSNILLEESEILGATALNYSRNKIDRFTGGVTSGALFTERPSFGGTVELNCLIRKKFHGRSPVSDSERPSPEACAGVLLLALLDVGNGIQPVGGAASVGRGLLKLRSLKIDGKETVRQKTSFVLPDKEHSDIYLCAAAEYLGGESLEH